MWPEHVAVHRLPATVSVLFKAQEERFYAEVQGGGWVPVSSSGSNRGHQYSLFTIIKTISDQLLPEQTGLLWTGHRTRDWLLSGNHLLQQLVSGSWFYASARRETRIIFQVKLGVERLRGHDRRSENWGWTLPPGFSAPLAGAQSRCGQTLNLYFSKPH